MHVLRDLDKTRKNQDHVTVKMSPYQPALMGAFFFLLKKGKMEDPICMV
jgi:hypothetical protein